MNNAAKSNYAGARAEGAPIRNSADAAGNRRPHSGKTGGEYSKARYKFKGLLCSVSAGLIDIEFCRADYLFGGMSYDRLNHYEAKKNPS